MIETVPDRACAIASSAAGEDPTGWAVAADRFVLAEVALPWPADIEAAPGLPPGLRETLDPLTAERQVGRTVHFEAIVPGSGAPPIDGRVRVLLFDRPSVDAARYRRVEALLATTDVAPLVDAWAAGGDLAGWAADIVPDGGTRDVVVCTHGAHDPCCGRFGAVAHGILAGQRDARVRVWRGSHTGGHRFAPTLIDLPDGRSWGRLTPHDLTTILRRDASPRTLAGRYRGLGSLPTYYERLVEAQLFMAEGWTWTDRRVRGDVLEGHTFTYPEDPDELDDRAIVRIEADAAAWEATVERGADRQTRGECGEPPWSSPSYSVTSLRRVS